MKVLLSIDNSKGILDRLFRLIRGIPGADLITAPIELNEIMAYVQGFQPDVLVVDLCLSDGTAMDVMRALGFTNKKLTLIILTDQPYEDIENQLKALGADFVLNKSLEFELIIKILSRLGEKDRGSHLAV